MTDQTGEAQPRGDELPVRLVHWLYVISTAGISMSFSEQDGQPMLMVLGVTTVIFWSLVFFSRHRPRAFCYAMMVLFAIGLLYCFVPAVGRVGPLVMQRFQCKNNLGTIGLALANYHEAYGCLPPAFVSDDDGRLMHSWRVLILPFAGHEELYGRYDLDQPWDSPQNQTLLPEIPSFYQCPAARSLSDQAGPFTSYVVVIGSRTAWPGPNGRTRKEIAEADGLSNTALVVEVNGKRILWMEPRDLNLEEALPILSSLDIDEAGFHPGRTFFEQLYLGRHVLMADFYRNVWLVGPGLAAEQWAKALIFDDQATWWPQSTGPQYLDGEVGSVTRPRAGNWLRLGLFLLLIVLPLPWVWINPTPGLLQEKDAFSAA